ncbi:MAG: Rossman fold protein, TIGR00730 family [Bacteroidetes bacterium 4572_77]|nr:MAG: Rossman fold protein, TIGR00730 family [Bacteroidetes bacterium 4572_77]
MKKICVFCGSSMGTQAVYRKKAVELAQYFIKNDLTLVYGGADVGLMKILADTMLEAGKEVIGVMPKNLVEKEVAHNGLTELIVVETMAARKEVLIEMSDAFIALPGGFGTLDELAEVLVLDQLHIIEKPLGLLNVNHYFDHLEKFMRLGVQEGFIRKEHFENMMIHEEAQVLVEKLKTYQPIAMNKWIKDIKEESK